MGNPGLYIAAAGGMAQLERMDHLTNNLANVGTTGYKASRPVFSVQRPDYDAQVRFPPAPGSADERRATSFVTLSAVGMDMGSGTVAPTGNPYDVALGGEGYFAVSAADGSTLYTRAGDFRLDGEGRLVTRGGLPVQDEGGGEIRPGGGTMTIDEGGGVSVDGQRVATLQVAMFDDTIEVERVGDNLLRIRGEGGGAPTPKRTGNPQVMQGALESSNVNPVTSMVDLISANRAFEQFTKTVQAIDDMDQGVINQMAKPR